MKSNLEIRQFDPTFFAAPMGSHEFDLRVGDEIQLGDREVDDEVCALAVLDTGVREVTFAIWLAEVPALVHMLPVARESLAYFISQGGTGVRVAVRRRENDTIRISDQLQLVVLRIGHDYVRLLQEGTPNPRRVMSRRVGSAPPSNC